MYLDAKCLYGWAMSQPLPKGGLKWLKEDKGPVIIYQLGGGGLGWAIFW